MVKLKHLGALVLSLASCSTYNRYEHGKVVEEQIHHGVSGRDLQYRLKVQSPYNLYPYNILVTDGKKQRLLDLATKVEKGTDVRFLVYREVCLGRTAWHTRSFFNPNQVGTLSSKDISYRVE